MLTRLRDVRRAGDDSGFTLAETLVGASLAGVAGLIGLGLFIVVAQQGQSVSTTTQLAASDRTALSQVASQLQLADSPTANRVTADGRFEAFQANSVTFYANLYSTSRVDVPSTPPPSAIPFSRTPPSKITIGLVDDPNTATKPSYAKVSNLVMTVWNPTNRYGSTSSNPYPSPYSYSANYPTTPSSTTVLATGVANDVTLPNEALFTYCSSAPDPTPTATVSTTPSCAGIAPSASDPANAARISSVIVRLKVADAIASKTSAADYRPATWLTTRVAISGRVEAPAATTTAAGGS